MGMAAIAGCPYWCANYDLDVALVCMNTPALITMSDLWDATSFAADTFSIDSPSNINKAKIWLFSGTQDTIVAPGIPFKRSLFVSFPLLTNPFGY
jgi:hypothetical protein